MIAQPTTWVNVVEHMYVQAKDGTAWRVLARRYDDGWVFRLVNRARQIAEMRVGPDDAVTVLVPTRAEMETMCIDILGAQVLERRFIRMEHVATYPDSKWARAAMAAHLLNMHHLSITSTADEQNRKMAELVELHNLDHAKPASDWVPHIHVDEP